MLIDTHLHLIYRNQLKYAWLADNPALNTDATYDDYHTVANRIGISCALHMEVDVDDSSRVAETHMIESLMAQPDCLLKGVIASCRPESSEFPAYLEDQQSRASLKGFRRVLHVVADDVSTTSLFRDNIKRLSGTGLTFDLCVLPHQMPIAAELIDHCPEVTFILDHCGVPDIKNSSLHPWSENLKSLALRPNVIGKISGIMAYGNLQDWTLNDLRPYVEHTIESFGWQRVVWGSDSPVCTLGGSLETWVAATHALIEGCSDDEKAALTHANAQRLWNL